MLQQSSQDVRVSLPHRKSLLRKKRSAFFEELCKYFVKIDRVKSSREGILKIIAKIRHTETAAGKKVKNKLVLFEYKN